MAPDTASSPSSARVPRVTALRPRGRSTVEVWLDGLPWRTLHEDVVVQARLAVGVAVDRERAVAVARARRHAHAMGVALRALRERDHSVVALERRLARRGAAPDVREQTVERLRHAGLVDDHRAAAARARALAARGQGDRAIRADLEARGFGDDATAEAIAALAPEAERLAEVLERHGRTLATARLLGRRGFAEDAVDDLIASLTDSAIA